MGNALRNCSRAFVLAERVVVADRFWTRLRGMIGRDFSRFDAMIFPNCRSVHTFWMRTPIDLIYVDRNRRVLEHRKASPWRIFFGPRGTETIVELPVNCRGSLECGDQLAW